MMVCRQCQWVGASDERKWGNCPKCGKRNFISDIELWARRVAVASFISFVAYLMVHLAHR